MDREITLAMRDATARHLCRCRKLLCPRLHPVEQTRSEAAAKCGMMSEQSTKLVQSAYLPHVALTGGYIVSNPTCSTDSKKNSPDTECRHHCASACMELGLREHIR
jgi:hypothetical protein